MEAQIPHIHPLQAFGHRMQEARVYGPRDRVAEEVTYLDLQMPFVNRTLTTSMLTAERGGRTRTNLAYNWFHRSLSGFMTLSLLLMSSRATQPCCIASVEISFHSVARQASKSDEYRILANLSSIALINQERDPVSLLFQTRFGVLCERL
jgi:hypothetical protein